MKKAPRVAGKRRMRVLLIGTTGAASLALAAWVGEQAPVQIVGPALTTLAALALAERFKPDVILLDFHGLPVSTVSTVTLLKELAPPPVVAVLTHEDSDVLRRHCREARVDAVFDKTKELPALAALLVATQKSLS